MLNTKHSITLNQQPLGDSLNSYKNINFIEADTPEELQAAIASIHVNFKVLSIYKDGSKHIAWILPMRKLTKRGQE